MSEDELNHLCYELRKKIVKMNYLSGTGHITSSCSCLEILVALYFGGVLKYDSHKPLWTERDYFLISKGHAALAVYSVLSEAGFFPEEDLWTFCQIGSKYGGHPNLRIPGVESTSGSLGHGLSIASGIALGTKLNNGKNRIFCLTGDGELQEGSNWEAALAISHFNMDNFTWIIDRNKLQIAGETEEIIRLEDLSNKLTSFGFDVKIVDGHDVKKLVEVLSGSSNKPLAIIANTIKGKGIPFLENKRGWHGRKTNNEELGVILKELSMTEEDLKK